MALELPGFRGVTVTEADFFAYLAARPDGSLPSSPMPPTTPPSGVKRKKPRGPGSQPLGTWTLDVPAFADAVDQALADNTAGYVMELRQAGAPIASMKRHAALSGPAETGFSGAPSIAWTSDVSMHIASCSKMLTAIALTKLLADTNVDSDSSIFDHLPSYWTVPDSVRGITFAALMEQRSGLLDDISDSGPESYTAAEQAIAGFADILANDIGFSYRNVNFILCRILIAILNGNIDRTAMFSDSAAFNDSFWDLLTTSAYAQYVQDNILRPAGVTDAVLTRPQVCALAYTYPIDGPGWNSGDLSWTAGAAGWHMSVTELLDVMGTFRRSGTIMAPDAAQALLDRGFAVDPIQINPLPAPVNTSNAGLVYGKNGGQSRTDPRNTIVGANTQLEQCAAYYLPQDMELVVFVNSPVGDFFFVQWLLGQVADIYNDNLVFHR